MMRIIRSGLGLPSNTKCYDPHIKSALSNLFYSTNVRCGYSSFFCLRNINEDLFETAETVTFIASLAVREETVFAVYDG